MSQTKDAFNISDFAKDLLVQMRFGNDDQIRALDIGHVSIPDTPPSSYSNSGMVLDSFTVDQGTAHVCRPFYGGAGSEKGQSSLDFKSLR